MRLSLNVGCLDLVVFVKLEICEAARRGQSCSSQKEQLLSSRSLTIVARFSQSASELCHPTNRMPFDPPKHWGQIPFRLHANYVQVRS